MIVEGNTYPNPPTQRLKTDIFIDTRVAPLLFRFDYGKKFKAFVNAGGYAAYIQRLQGRTIVPRDNSIRDSKRFYKSYEFGLAGGMGVSYTFKDKVSFSFEVRSNYGLSDIKNREYFISLPEPRFNEPYKLSTLNFLFGVTHHLICK